MAVDIYNELIALHARCADLETKVARLELKLTPKVRPAPITYFRADKLTAAGTSAWDAVIAKKPALAMINPGSGPGLTPSVSYTALVAKAQTAGVPIFGYTHSQYGLRPPADVKLDIDRHIAWYGCEGIFIDTTSNKPEHVAYYQDLCNYVHSKGRKVVLNTGTQCLEAHAIMADYLMCSEGDVPTYRARVPRPWEVNYPGKLWHAVHGCPPVDMPGVVALAKQRGAGLLYVTEDVMPNPWDTLTASWDALCAEIAKV